MEFSLTFFYNPAKCWSFTVGRTPNQLRYFFHERKKNEKKHPAFIHFANIRSSILSKYFSQIPSVATRDRSRIAVSTCEYGELQERVQCLLLQFFNAVKPRNSQKTRWRKWAKFQFNSHFKREKRVRAHDAQLVLKRIDC